MARPIRLEDLPEAILHKIAQYVEPWERRTVLPLVSRGWARLLGGPSPAWEEIIIARHQDRHRDATTSATFNPPPCWQKMEAWLSRRAGAVRDLRVTTYEEGPYRDHHFAPPILPASVLAAALGTHAHQLRVLIIELPAISLSSADLDAVLKHAPNLEEISLFFDDVPECWDDRGAALMQTLSRLPALQGLSIRLLSAVGNHPTVVELAALSSVQLTELYMSIDTSTESTLSFGDLPALTNCELGGYGTDVHVTASSFSGAPNLTAFCAVGFHSIHLSPDCFASLSFLTDLRLFDCDLLVVPPALAAVKGTLRCLDLSSNNSLRVEEIGYGALLSLSALERLNLSGFEDGTELVWDIRSVQYLVRFLTEWQALRPGVKLPRLTVGNRG